jgi:hypothetical protein
MRRMQKTTLAMILLVAAVATGGAHATAGQPVPAEDRFDRRVRDLFFALHG